MIVTTFQTNGIPYGVTCCACGGVGETIGSIAHYAKCNFTLGAEAMFKELSICSMHGLNPFVDAPIIRELDNVWIIKNKAGEILEYVAGGLNEKQAIFALDRQLFPNRSEFTAEYLNREFGSVKLRGEEIPPTVRPDIVSLFNSNNRRTSFTCYTGIALSYIAEPHSTKLVSPNTTLAALFDFNLHEIAAIELPQNKTAVIDIHGSEVVFCLTVEHAQKAGGYKIDIHVSPEAQ